MGIVFAALKLNLYFLLLTCGREVWSMLIIKDEGISCSETQCWYVSLKSELFFGQKLGEGSTFPVLPLHLLHVSFPNTPLTHLLVNTRSPPYSFKRFVLFALTTTVALLMSLHLLMTPPAIFVPNAMSLTFFSIPEFTRLDLPILLITVQSPSLHFFFQLLTVILIKNISDIS